MGDYTTFNLTFWLLKLVISEGDLATTGILICYLTLFLIGGNTGFS